MSQAIAAARGKDVRISGDAAAIRQYIDAGLIEELTLHIAPVLLGDGVKLFEQIAPDALTLSLSAVSNSSLVTPIQYMVARTDPSRDKLASR